MLGVSIPDQSDSHRPTVPGPSPLPVWLQVRRLLEREPALATTIDAQLRTALHRVAAGTSMPTSRQAIAAMLLAAAPQTAAAIDHMVGSCGAAAMGRQLCSQQQMPCQVTHSAFPGSWRHRPPAPLFWLQQRNVPIRCMPNSAAMPESLPP